MVCFCPFTVWKIGFRSLLRDRLSVLCEERKEAVTRLPLTTDVRYVSAVYLYGVKFLLELKQPQGELSLLEPTLRLHCGGRPILRASWSKKYVMFGGICGSMSFCMRRLDSTRESAVSMRCVLPPGISFVSKW